MTTFNDLWKLLYDHGGINRNRVECNNFWDELSPAQREQLFTTISNKLNIGKFVHYDPLRAMRENNRIIKPLTPEFLSGKQQDDCKKRGIPMVQVKYGNSFLICTAKTQQDFHLLKTRDW